MHGGAECKQKVVFIQAKMKYPCNLEWIYLLIKLQPNEGKPTVYVYIDVSSESNAYCFIYLYEQKVLNNKK